MKGMLTILALGALVLPGALAAQQADPPRPQDEYDNTRLGGTAAAFLTLPGDARGAALGGSYATLVTDVSSMFYNPAGLALGTQSQAMFSYTDYVAGTRHVTGGMSWSLRGGEWGLGLSISNFGFSDQPVYTEDFQDGNGELYSVSETAVGLTLSLQLSDKFSAGITPRYINDQLGRVTANGFTIDFGTSYHTEVSGRPFRASFLMLNYGTPLSHSGNVLNDEVDPLDGSMNVEDQPVRVRTSEFDPPTQFRVGVAYDVMSSANNRLTLMSEFNQPNDNEPGVGFGAEFSASVAEGLTAALRGSFSYQPDNADGGAGIDFTQSAFDSDAESDANLDGLALGGGLGWGLGDWDIGVDYAYRHLGILSGVNMFSLKLGW